MTDSPWEHRIVGLDEKSQELRARQEAECPLCAAGIPTTRARVFEMDFTNVEIRVLAWTEEEVDALRKGLAASVNDHTGVVKFYKPKPGDTFRFLESRTSTGRFGDHHIAFPPDGSHRRLPAMEMQTQVSYVYTAKKTVKRKNAPKGKRGRAQWWNK